MLRRIVFCWWPRYMSTRDAENVFMALGGARRNFAFCVLRYYSYRVLGGLLVLLTTSRLLLVPFHVPFGMPFVGVSARFSVYLVCLVVLLLRSC